MIFETDIKVRDYECDQQGVVNNANYLHYFELTRHEWMQSVGASFGDWCRRGIDAMVSRITVEYRKSLHGGELFVSQIADIRRKGPGFVFRQTILRKSDGKVCAKAEVVIVTVVNGQLSRGDEVAAILSPWIENKEE